MKTSSQACKGPGLLAPAHSLHRTAGVCFSREGGFSAHAYYRCTAGPALLGRGLLGACALLLQHCGTCFEAALLWGTFQKTRGRGIGKGFGPVIFLLQLLPPLGLTAPKFSFSDMSPHAQTAPSCASIAFWCPLTSSWGAGPRTCAVRVTRVGWESNDRP